MCKVVIYHSFREKMSPAESIFMLRFMMNFPQELHCCILLLFVTSGNILVDSDGFSDRYPQIESLCIYFYRLFMHRHENDNISHENQGGTAVLKTSKSRP